MNISSCKVCNSPILNTTVGRPRTLCSSECRKVYSRISTAASFALKTPEERKVRHKIKNDGHRQRLREAKAVAQAQAQAAQQVSQVSQVSQAQAQAARVPR